MKTSSSLRIALQFFLAGLIIPSLVTYFSVKMISTYNKNLPYISLGDNIKNKTTKGHLWFEELLAGDEGVNFEKDVLYLFNSSLEILKTARTSGFTELGNFEASEDIVLIRILDNSIKDLEELIELTNRRYTAKVSGAEAREKAEIEKALIQKLVAENASLIEEKLLNSLSVATKLTSGEEAGGDLDKKFDAAYEAVQSDMDKIVEHVNTKVDSESKTVKMYAILLVVFILVLTIIFCINLYRSRQKTAALITENEEKLQFESQRINKINDFVTSITNNNFSETLDTGKDDDALAITLNEMKNKLKTNLEEEKKRNWSNGGLAKMSELLRDSDLRNSEVFYNNIISFTVKYLDANQGALFILNDEKKGQAFLEMVACYAYDKRKFIEKRIEIGEGLVSQCFLEKEPIFMTNVPDQYTYITSGLGEATPASLVLMPLKLDGKVNGVLEIASFNVFQKHEIEFIGKLTENIAASISSYRVSIRTNILLEQTQQQAEEMRAQEEEMRQNMEEMAATQEEFMRKEQSYIKEIENLKATQIKH